MILVLAIFFSCAKDSLFNENMNMEKSINQAVMVPAKCWFTTIPDLSQDFILCSPEDMGVALLKGGWMKGHLTHGGKLNAELSFYRVISCEFDYMTMKVTESIDGTHTAANGDYYFYTGTLTVDVTNGDLSGTVTVTGGTGRYDGATASLTITGIHNLVTNVATMTGEGLWTFPK